MLPVAELTRYDAHLTGGCASSEEHCLHGVLWRQQDVGEHAAPEALQPVLQQARQPRGR